MDAENAFIPVAEVMERAGVTFDKSRYLPGIVGIIARRRDHAFLPIQLVLADPLLQQGHLSPRGAGRRQSPKDLAGGLVGGAADHPKRCRHLRLYVRLAYLDPPGEFCCVEQPSLRHQRERHGRIRHRVDHQCSDLREAFSGACRSRGGRGVSLWRTDLGSQTALSLRGMRHVSPIPRVGSAMS